jgi:hypothetical protein
MVARWRFVFDHASLLWQFKASPASQNNCLKGPSPSPQRGSEKRGHATNQLKVALGHLLAELFPDPAFGSPLWGTSIERSTSPERCQRGSWPCMQGAAAHAADPLQLLVHHPGVGLCRRFARPGRMGNAGQTTDKRTSSADLERGFGHEEGRLK